MFTDVIGLSIALGGTRLMERPASEKHTWGYRRVEILAAAGQSLLLIAVGVFVTIEAIQRLINPTEVEPLAMLSFGIFGLLANCLSLVLLSKIEEGNLNTRAAFLEVINDALGSLAVVIAGVIILTTGWIRADALVSLFIGVMILPRSWKLLRATVNIILEVTPKDVKLSELRTHIMEIAHVQEVHDMHASLVGTGLPIFTAHVVLDEDCFSDGHLIELLPAVQAGLRDHFDVEHSTIQFEPASHSKDEYGLHD
jgi:cobalt-zinc-cadmium efflux system protein